jgi:hypothetical protein
MKNFRAADKSHVGGDEKHDINFHWPYQKPIFLSLQMAEIPFWNYPH